MRVIRIERLTIASSIPAININEPKQWVEAKSGEIVLKKLKKYLREELRVYQETRSIINYSHLDQVNE